MAGLNFQILSQSDLESHQATCGIACQNLPHVLQHGNLWTLAAVPLAPYLARPWICRNLTQHFLYSHLLSAYSQRPGRIWSASHTHTGCSRNICWLTAKICLPWRLKADSSVNPAHVWNAIVVIRSLYSPGELSHKCLHNCYLWILTTG